jgi:hypothetical protein
VSTTPEDGAERLARVMVRDAVLPLRNYRPPDAGAIAKLRGEVARARLEGRRAMMHEVLAALPLLVETDDIDEYRRMLVELAESAGIDGAARAAVGLLPGGTDGGRDD